jgi:hypothetical protein
MSDERLQGLREIATTAASVNAITDLDDYYIDPGHLVEAVDEIFRLREQARLDGERLQHAVSRNHEYSPDACSACGRIDERLAAVEGASDTNTPIFHGDLHGRAGGGEGEG